MKEIKLTNSKMVSIVDDNMFKELNEHNWYLHTSGYVQSTVNNKKVYMHRLVNQTLKGKETDHINGNKLDNRRENLRTCTKSQNQINVDRTKNSQTGYRGVTFDSRKSKYQARIRINGKQTHIGLYKTAEEAALAYNIVAEKHHGEFAKFNREIHRQLTIYDFI